MKVSGSHEEKTQPAIGGITKVFQPSGVLRRKESDHIVIVNNSVID